MDQSSTLGLTNVKDSQKEVQWRSIGLSRIMKLLNNDEYKVILLQGPQGTGKTKLVTELAQFLSVRKTFKDGVFYHDFVNAKTMKDADEFFKNSLF